MIGVFDRSHYEDVLVPRVHDLIPEPKWSARYDEINEFEARDRRGGTTVVKCFLHISYETQRERLLARLDDPNKHWKFNEGDLDRAGASGRTTRPRYEAMLRALQHRRSRPGTSCPATRRSTATGRSANCCARR